MRRFSHRLYYYLESLLTRGPLYQLMLVAFLIVLLSLSGGLFVHYTDPQAYSNTLEAIWWAFLRLTDPGYLGDDRGFFPRLISTFLTVAGYVVFLGALVALMTTWLDRSLQYLASGRSQIFEEGHTLIIGWNDRIHALVEEVTHSQGLLQPSDSTVSIVILCDPYHPTMYRELVQKLKPNVRRRSRIQIRSGDPLEADSLTRVDFAHAKAIILISGAGGGRAERSLSDVTLAKVVMSLKALAPEIDPPPNVVVEVANPGNKLLVESVGWAKSTEAVVADLIMGRLFCQAIRFPGISRVYHRLLTDTFGYSLTLHRADSLDLEGKCLRETVQGLRAGTPIGLLLEAGGQENLHLLDFEHTFRPGDQVVVVRSQNPRECAEVGSTASGHLRPINSSKIERELLINGWSTDLFTLLAELAANPDETSRVTLVWEKEIASERERLEQLASAHPNLTLRFQTGTLLDEEAVRRCGLEQFHKILLLADQTQPPLVADAENVLRYVLLERAIAAREFSIDLVVELNDEDNRPLLTGRPVDVLMTGEILSHLLAQVSIHRSLMWIYEELFTKGGAELRLRAVDELESGETSFGDLQYLCLQSNAVAIGYCREREVLFNPAPSAQLEPCDLLILVETE